MSRSLDQLVGVLEEIAPLHLAEDWDNVGLLVEPAGRKRVRRCFLTIDLTELVLEEAAAAKADMIVAYHPPIFAPLSRLTQEQARQRVLLAAVAAKMAVYSPHTALDAARGGVNDWLADGLGQGHRVPLQPADLSDPGIGGQGRLVELSRPVGLDTLQRRIKSHLGLKKLRIARAPGPARAMATVAVCAGSGGEVVSGSGADVYFTGEMRHHDVLAAVEGGANVILAEHTHTERGYLPILAERLRAEIGSGVEILVSLRDADPLTII
ncbi:MAG: Nif3-like dinuclear metal center hexameric protein [Planctomycetota bacterium]|jgi:dinuclear metal center YbgI/SA1388 family protein|nr:Nif3-like dinuclear metal center hexameric protein [Planctomycetota bacterium]